MVVLKTASQVALMKQAGEISAGALIVARDHLKVGASTAEIDRVICEYIKSFGAEPSFLNYNGFPASSCISINDEVIHGIPSNHRKIRDGDIVSIDVGAKYRGYHGDNAATFEVGNVSELAKKLVKVTRESLDRAVAAAVKGNRIGDIGFAVQSHVEQNGFSVVRNYIGHGLGKKLHEAPEVPNYGTAGRGIRLVPGMTLAIEPMVNAGGFEVDVLDDDWTVVTSDKSLSAHFEYSIVITENEPVILTPWQEAL